jgi:hypothetical protein
MAAAPIAMGLVSFRENMSDPFVVQLKSRLACSHDARTH